MSIGSRVTSCEENEKDYGIKGSCAEEKRWMRRIEREEKNPEACVAGVENDGKTISSILKPTLERLQKTGNLQQSVATIARNHLAFLRREQERQWREEEKRKAPKPTRQEIRLQRLRDRLQNTRKAGER